MSNCSECAFCKANGTCLMRKTDCSYAHCCRACPDFVARVTEALHRHVRAWLRQAEDLSTSKKRFAFRTRKSTKWQVFRTCVRKRRFRSEHEAMEKAVYLYRRKGLSLAVYECPFCGGYHLTRQLRDHLPHVGPGLLETAEVA